MERLHAAFSIAVLLLRNVYVTSAVCEGTETFERVTGVILHSARQIPLYTSNGAAITTQCTSRCRASAACPAFLIDYDRGACFRLDLTSQGRAHLLTPARGHTAYFEKVCLQAPACGRAWVFERLLGRELAGLDDLVLEQISSRRACQEFCLLNHQLPCRSAEYVAGRRLCRLSSSSRRTAPLSLRPAADTEYMENQCVPHVSSSGCDWEKRTGRQMSYVDLQVTAVTEERCQRACETASSFSCRSFTYSAARSLCWLSSEDISSVGPAALVPSRGAVFSQRTPCHDLELLCAADRMTLRLRTAAPFTGRIFSLDAPATCEVRGSGQLTTEATFIYQDTRCGVMREGTGSYSVLVAVQRHSMIQRRDDNAVKLLCSYEAPEQTVSNGITLLTDRIDGGLVTSSVNGTAPAPIVSLHVRDRSGAEVTGTALGEPLLLSIEMEDNRIFAMFPRNLVARSGRSGESIVLLDERGCPTDESVVERFRPKDGAGSRMVAHFEAFKFYEDPVVRFQVTVQFCLERCQPAQCDGMPSRSHHARHGRSAASVDTVTGQRVLHEAAPLQREIIVGGASERQMHEPRLSEPGLRDGRTEDLLCARREAVIAGIAVAVFLQAVLLVVCCTCVYWRRRSKLRETLPSTSTLSSSRQRLEPPDAGRPATLRTLRSLTQRH